MYTIYMLEAQNITVSGGGSLSGVTQGAGSHLLGRTITLNTNDWLATQINDDDANFDDNDGSGQTLAGSQTIGGVTYTGNRVEAEYKLVLRDPATGDTWTVIGYNVNNSSPSYGTIEGLAFIGGVGGFPPRGIALEVISAQEGPGAGGQPATAATDYATPPCFTPSTRIDTPAGPRTVEALRPGDLVLTRDHGAQPLRWTGRVRLSPAELAAAPRFRPVRIAAGAFGPGLPERPLTVSPQHRMLVEGPRCELLFGAAEVLVAALHLAGQPGVAVDPAPGGVTYLHLMFDRHEIIRAEGAWTESLHAGALDRLHFAPAARAELLALFPELAAARPRGALARPALRAWEARLLVA